MAKTKVHHSEDACHIIIKGDKRNPEPTLHVIQFPGGAVEVSRCSDGSYYTHVHVNESAKIIDSRVDYPFEIARQREDQGLKSIPKIDCFESIQKIAVKIKGAFESSATL
ncbi:hypothetical protein A1QO_02715 [Vibrio genomosp. F10 str. ZF-129]|uniref:Uncharacterized protein n=1 Tax=Vibrio genomosp. F10 str. ZF-129 TaxID=1187848 RepID=A0A1E5BLI6_9VIBR|nr:hypothetical protein [Vibrio genomosp. F10]OEE38310.1 hypothetical protein A1QO_02715 [Vibrio genomosp. F10 str. ZF-129]